MNARQLEIVEAAMAADSTATERRWQEAKARVTMGCCWEHKPCRAHAQFLMGWAAGYLVRGQVMA